MPLSCHVMPGMPYNSMNEFLQPGSSRLQPGWSLQCMYTVQVPVFQCMGSAKACNCMHRVSTLQYVLCMYLIYTWHVLRMYLVYSLDSHVIKLYIPMTYTVLVCTSPFTYNVQGTYSGLTPWHRRVWRKYVLAAYSKRNRPQFKGVSFPVKIPIFSLVHDLYM